jgi:hypothetical protein
MSIPASIAISKLRVPEVEEPVTRGRIVVDRGEDDTERAPVDALHAFAKGAVLGLGFSGLVCNVVSALCFNMSMTGGFTPPSALSKNASVTGTLVGILVGIQHYVNVVFIEDSEHGPGCVEGL